MPDEAVGDEGCEVLADHSCLGHFVGELLDGGSTGDASPAEIAAKFLQEHRDCEAATWITVEEDLPAESEFLPESAFDTLEKEGSRDHPQADTELLKHLVYVAQVLHVFVVFGASMKFEKSQKGQEHLNLLGNEIGQQKMRKDPGKLEALHKYPRPKTPKNISELLGFLQFL